MIGYNKNQEESINQVRASLQASYSSRRLIGSPESLFPFKGGKTSFSPRENFAPLLQESFSREKRPEKLSLSSAHERKELPLSKEQRAPAGKDFSPLDPAESPRDFSKEAEIYSSASPVVSDPEPEKNSPIQGESLGENKEKKEDFPSVSGVPSLLAFPLLVSLSSDLSSPQETEAERVSWEEGGLGGRDKGIMEILEEVSFERGEEKEIVAHEIASFSPPREEISAEKKDLEGERSLETVSSLFQERVSLPQGERFLNEEKSKSGKGGDFSRDSLSGASEESLLGIFEEISSPFQERSSFSKREETPSSLNLVSLGESELPREGGASQVGREEGSAPDPQQIFPSREALLEKGFLGEASSDEPFSSLPSVESQAFLEEGKKLLPPSLREEMPAFLPLKGGEETLRFLRPVSLEAGVPSSSLLKEGERVSLPHFPLWVRKEIEEGRHRFQVSLEPESLGKVHIQLEIRDDHYVHAVLSLEKQSTLDLLQKDASQLREVFQGLGLQTDGGSLNFNLSSQEEKEESFSAAGNLPASLVVQEIGQEEEDLWFSGRRPYYGGGLSGINVLV